jgi:hypothetical protein
MNLYYLMKRRYGVIFRRLSLTRIIRDKMLTKTPEHLIHNLVGLYD